MAALTSIRYHAKKTPATESDTKPVVVILAAVVGVVNTICK